MQCPSCGFENMPGNEGCARCGTSLTLATAILDVNPPRASEFSKRVRRSIPQFLRANSVLRHLGRGAAERASSAVLRVKPKHWALIWRSIIPGWAHYYDHQERRGRMFLSAYLSLILSGILMYGTTLGAMSLGLGIAAHVMAIIDLLSRYKPERLDVPTWLT